MTTRVLLVDDEAGFTAALGKVLSRRDLCVTVCPDGPSALAAASDADVVLLDVKMPGMDGLEVLDRLRVAEPGTPVILMTGHLAPGEEEAALARGAFAFVLKPYPVPDLLALIAAATVERRR